MPVALIHVQHLLGIGHLARAARLAAALAESGVETTVAMGGAGPMPFPLGGARLVRLPAIRADASDLARLLDADGMPLDAAGRAARLAASLAVLAEVDPDILVIEAWPFGRRAMAFELLPLAEAARAGRPRLIACSIRDLLQESRRPGRAGETVETLRRLFDLVLVHGEAETPLSLTFPLADSVAGLVRYTGMVGPRARPRGAPVHDVVVSTGGGAVGDALLAAALGAARAMPPPDRPWLLLRGLDRSRPGGQDPVPEWVQIADFVPDLAAVLAAARLSVSQAGYNTVADILASGVAAVLCPFAAGGETEQARRAERLHLAGRAIHLPEAALTPARLAAAMSAARQLPEAPPQDLSGAARAATLLLDAWSARHRMTDL
jgi:predicted glycosyltransferase